MTAKEKANELVDKYMPFVEAFSFNQQEDNAKQCALIAVDEVIKHIRVNLGGGTHQGVWWLEVKQEIEKL